jgi:hypothetical protein
MAAAAAASSIDLLARVCDYDRRVLRGRYVGSRPLCDLLDQRTYDLDRFSRTGPCFICHMKNCNPRGRRPMTRYTDSFD